MGIVYIHTWGCQLNEHKSEEIAGTLERTGFQLTERLEEAEVVIFNTCTVREKAVEKVLGKLGEVNRLRARGRVILLGIGGCLSQAEGERLLRRARGVRIDFLFGTSASDIKRLPEIIARAREGQPVIAVGQPAGLDHLPARRASSFKAYVTITEGCDHFCSYCIVPYTRGRLRSRPMEEVQAEVEELARQGYKEVTLLGQNVNAYGKDLFGEGRFAALLRRVAETGIRRIRFTSSHPEDMTEDLLRTIAQLPNVSKQLHIAAQSGSDRVLKDMRRPYTKAEFLEKVELAKRLIPGVNITTDLIVGYPTETEEDFQETIDLVEQARFGSAFIFKFSPRPGTIAAAKYGDPIPQEVKERRHRVLLELQRRISEEESAKLIGAEVEVLVEGQVGPNCYGKAQDGRTVTFSGRGCAPGELVAVRVAKTAWGTLLGTA
ncbi:MAG: tRNA (N6-isopentenyl adenosine(37)-C2)-methylthiotransferase MiaB [Candidatus Acetothermia bacterium]|jgi:tRNA-2-methylthio-N6-dimethylallyladenosine synthase|nr:tRNA (N6-isopentenyl adenosine(37)-C2)-methylthiotransferase MiaB [Candidatus Acetothermia bacterium]MDH7505187.1 tRNA (N6-isopentenyl adenosine(37)-C2)-methylthiotransferase MiaB [Candidatus Acetothermia bacterium]